MRNVVAEFTIGQRPSKNAEFSIEENQAIDTIFQINATPSKVSQLENDLDFQTGEEVSASIQAESNVINTRIDNEVEVLNSSIGGLDDNIDNHIANTLNPHEVTKAQVGLGNCDNTSDINKPISTAQQNALDGKVDKLTTLPTAGTYTKVIINSQGQVTEGETLLESDIPSLHLTKISDVTATATELNILNGATITTAELNVLDGITASTTELNYVDGVTSSIQTQFNNITDLIPSSATTLNQLADKDFVNSSVSTNTANFIGTFNSVAELEAYSGTLTNNDYAFVATTDSAGNTLYDRYKYNAGTQEWMFEYELNNSSFTAQQWASINSGATTTNIGQIAINANDISDLQANKQNVLTAGTNIQINNNIISATDTTYTAGTGISIINGVISNTQTSAEWGNITGVLSSQTDLQDALDNKYDASNPNGYTSVVESTVSGWGFTKNAGTVTSVNNVSPVNGNVSLTIPTVNNATLTITQGGVSKGTFTANASSDVTIALDSGGGGTWGSITGTLSDQTDLQNALNDKVEYSMVITDYTA